MAVLHRATLTPGKSELIERWLDHQPWGGHGAVELLGSYRFDDPAGEVGIEGFLIRRGEEPLHLALTYRSAPLAGADEALVGRMQHSVLGERWVYPAGVDPVGVGCFERALHGQQEQATIEVHDGGRVVDRRESEVRLRCEPGDAAAAAITTLRLAERFGDASGAAGPRLLARLGDVEAPIAWLA